MKLKKLIVSLIALCMGLCAFAGCGKTGDNGTNLIVLYESTLNPNYGKADKMLQYTKESLEIKKDVYTEAKYIATKNAVDAVKEHGLTVEYYDWDWATKLRQKQVSAFIAGEGPDIMIGETQMPDFVNQGLIKPFPEDMEKWVRENLVPAAYKPMEFGGKIYGAASQPSVSMLCANKSWTDKIFGVGYTMPASWAELLEDLDVVNKYKADRNINDASLIAGGLYMGPIEGGYLRTTPFFEMNGGGIVDAEQNPIYDSPENQETLQFLREVDSKNPQTILTSNKLTVFERFQAGTTVFVNEGCWMIKMSEELGFEISIGDLPLPEGGTPANMTVGAAFFSVPKYVGDKKAAAAFDYIKAFLSKESQDPLLNVKYRLPVNKASMTETFLTANPKFRPYYDGMLIDNIRTVPTFKYENAKCWDYVGGSMSEAGKRDRPKSIDKILQDAQKSIQTVYDRNK